MRTRLRLLGGCFVAFVSLFVAATVIRAQETWTAPTSPTTQNLWSVCYGAGQFVAVGEGGTILTSPDGTAWTKRVSGSALWLVGVGYGNGLFVVVGDQGTILTSPDAITWTVRKSTGTRINAVAYGNGTFIAVDDGGYCLASIDGVSWSVSPTNRTGDNVTNYLRGLVYGAPQFAITGANSIQTTFDGSQFTTRVSSDSAGMLEGLAYGRRLFIAAGGAGATFTSRDAVTWIQQPTTTDITVRGAAFFNNQFIAVGNAVANGGGIATSFDGARWTPRTSDLTAGTLLLATAAGPDSVVAVGQAGKILRSVAASNAPAIVAQPVGITEAIGGNVAFTVTASGSAPLSFQWKKDGQPISGATSDTLFLTAVQNVQAAGYSCTITNSAGSVTSATATLTVVNSFPLPDPVDQTFNLNPSLDKVPSTAAVQSDGKILIGGSFLVFNQGVAQFGLARLNPEGSLDAAFKPAAINSDGYVSTIAIQSDGKILIGGSFATIGGQTRQNLARLNADGSLDGSFVAASSATAIPVLQILVPADSRIIVVNGSSTIARLNADGSVDSSFVQSPIVVAPGSFSRSGIQLADLLPDGRILAVGSGPVGFFSDNAAVIRRFNVDGTPDSTWADIRLGGMSLHVMAVRVLPDGRVMVAKSGADPFFVQRYLSNGAPDPSFTALVSRDSGNSLSCVSFASDGKTWLSGSFATVLGVARNQLVRLKPDGTLDVGYSPGAGFGAGISASLLLALDDGRALVAGPFTTINGTSRRYFARLNARSDSGASFPTVLSVDPSYVAVRAGEGFALNLTVTGSPAISYSATLPNGSRLGAGSSVLTVSNAQTSGIYTLSAANSVSASLPVSAYVRVLPSAPIIVTQPAPIQTNAGRSIALTVATTGSDPRAYQWFKDSNPIPGATGANYLLNSASAGQTGDYAVVVRNSLGLATSQTVHVGVDETSRFIDISTRAQVGVGENALIAGFVVSGPGAKRVMIRGVGPTLVAFNVPGVLADPVLTVYNATNTAIYTNDDWAAANDYSGVATANTRLGTFPLAANSADAAGILTLDPGSYTAVITGKNGATGVALAEVYEDDTQSSRLINLSSRAFVGIDAAVAISGIVIRGSNTPKKLLIRAVGPGLAQFGITGVLVDPMLTLTTSLGATVASNDDWETNSNVADIRTATANLAFPLAAGSRDAALLITLQPGNYTALVSGANNTTGVALVEVYEVP